MGAATQMFVAENDDICPGWLTDAYGNVDDGWYMTFPRVLRSDLQRNALANRPKIDPARSIWICPANPREQWDKPFSLLLE